MDAALPILTVRPMANPFGQRSSANAARSDEVGLRNISSVVEALTMRIAVISDIHGNGIALEAVLADLQRDAVDQVVCLGDAIQGGAQPGAVVRRLRELACPVVMGNADDFLLTGRIQNPHEIASAQQLAVRAWQLAQLTADERHFIESFQPTIELALGGGRRLLCFHASPHSFNDIILPLTPEDEALRYLGGFADRVLTGGHTHLQQLRRIG